MFVKTKKKSSQLLCHKFIFVLYKYIIIICVVLKFCGFLRNVAKRILLKKRRIEIDGFAALSSLPPDNSFFSCISEKVYFLTFLQGLARDSLGKYFLNLNKLLKINNFQIFNF